MLGSFFYMFVNFLSLTYYPYNVHSGVNYITF